MIDFFYVRNNNIPDNQKWMSSMAIDLKTKVVFMPVEPVIDKQLFFMASYDGVRIIKDENYFYYSIPWLRKNLISCYPLGSDEKPMIEYFDTVERIAGEIMSGKRKFNDITKGVSNGKG